ncbi:hypothetical protein [Staphylococcus pseudoxylosus]|uniref:hypothetical protein n=1 Tax=Staphylococcus pseudoxylosus TaxID=2282419 RepID=UPI002DB9387C|nr:hypothetical protein [Staphylococcus pseudoxylosus]MEB7752266.1 hypothetical protein [Staphylococcus pseudoxylosus]
MAEINHRYLKDNDGKIYFPVVHKESVIGWEELVEDLNESDENNQGNVSSLRIKIENLEFEHNTFKNSINKRIETINSQISEINTLIQNITTELIESKDKLLIINNDIETMKSDIEELKGNNETPPEGDNI